MSGLEIAGLVVGAVPLIIAGLELYAKGTTMSKRFVRYRQGVEDIVMQLKTEQTILRNSINTILASVVKPQEMQLFLSNPTGQRWQDARFETKLRSRLGSSYEVYLDNIAAMNAVLGEFKKKLKLKESGEPVFTEPNKFKENYKRLKFSLGKFEYDELMLRLRQANQSLHRLTTQIQALNNLQVGSKCNRRCVPRFRAINSWARGFHSALVAGWKCPCREIHRVNLRLEHRLDEEDVSSDDDEDFIIGQGSFHVVFCYNSQLMAKGKGAAPPWYWEEAEVRLVPQIPHEEPKRPAKIRAGQQKVSVRFETKPQRPVKAALLPASNLLPIRDLCAAISTLQNPQRDVCLSLLATEYAKQKVLIYPPKNPHPDRESWVIVPLGMVLKRTDLNREKRLRLGLTLASSLLQLYQTPWLDDNWGRNSVFFIQNQGRTGYDSPFVTWGSNTISLQTQATKNPIMGAVRSWPLFRLGVVLIELWYNKPLDEIIEFEQNQYAMNIPSPMADWHRADCLVDDLYTDAGEKYSDAVRRCIRCSFDTRETSLDNEAFQKAVYEGVVTQLKENLDFLYRQ